MRALNTRFVLVDVHNLSAFTNKKSSNYVSTIPAAFRRTKSPRHRPALSWSSSSMIRSPEIRKPRDRMFSGNGVSMIPSNLPSTSSSGSSEASSELEMFFELLPWRMRSELIKHEEIGELVEVVMDLGRKPLARFPSGDWVISEQPVKFDDLSHAISKRNSQNVGRRSQETRYHC